MEIYIGLIISVIASVWLSSKLYYELNKKYFGGNVLIDEEIKYEFNIKNISIFRIFYLVISIF